MLCTLMLKTNSRPFYVTESFLQIIERCSCPSETNFWLYNFFLGEKYINHRQQKYVVEFREQFCQRHTHCLNFIKVSVYVKKKTMYLRKPWTFPDGTFLTFHVGCFLFSGSTSLGGSIKKILCTEAYCIDVITILHFWKSVNFCGKQCNLINFPRTCCYRKFEYTEHFSWRY